MRSSPQAGTPRRSSTTTPARCARPSSAPRSSENRLLEAAARGHLGSMLAACHACAQAAAQLEAAYDFYLLARATSPFVSQATAPPGRHPRDRNGTSP
jgi:hypothetical protein